MVDSPHHPENDKGREDLAAYAAPKFVAALPPGSGPCVAMVEFKGRIIIACALGIFEYHPDLMMLGKGELEQLQFVNAAEGIAVDRKSV